VATERRRGAPYDFHVAMNANEFEPVDTAGPPGTPGDPPGWSGLVEAARALAAEAHRDQVYGSAQGPLPYTVHLEHVAEILVRFGHQEDPVLLAAAFLHDVVEDTELEPRHVEQALVGFGADLARDIAEIVWRLTDEPRAVPGQPRPSRRERKRQTLPKIAGDRRARLVKLADRLANSERSRDAPAFMKMYRAEMPEFESALRVEGEAEEMWRALREALGLEPG
jgi:(p)ppGpp synthase/HD superfamily hydrolase